MKLFFFSFFIPSHFLSRLDFQVKEILESSFHFIIKHFTRVVDIYFMQYEGACLEEEKKSEEDIRV